MLLEIQLQNIPNQTVSFSANGQNFNMDITTKTINRKTLQNNTPDIDNNTLIMTFGTVYLSNTPIIYNTLCVHAEYINQFTSNIKGYLFFYVDTADVGNDDAVNYLNFGTTTHLYYSDIDILTVNYNNWVKNNQPYLANKYIYGSITN